MYDSPRQAQITLERIDKYLQFVTVKASLIIPADFILIGLMLSAPGQFIEPFSGLSVRWVGVVIYIISLLLVNFSAIFAIRAIVAYLEGGAQPQKYHSLLYFGSIAQLELHEYIKRQNSSQPGESHRDMLRQIHLLSCALVQKYIAVNRSLHCLVGGILIPSVCLALVSILEIH